MVEFFQKKKNLIFLYLSTKKTPVYTRQELIFNTVPHQRAKLQQHSPSEELLRRGPHHL